MTTLSQPYRRFVAASLVAAACWLPQGHTAEAATPLLVEPATVKQILLLDQGEFHSLAAGTKLTSWPGAVLRQDASPGGANLEVERPAPTAADHHVRYGRTIRVEQGYRYEALLTYSTDIDGVTLELHHYAFSTFGDTVAVTREPVPPSPGGMRELRLPFTPAPGAISLFPRVVIPKGRTGTLRLRRFNITGYTWGGQAYGAVPAADYHARDWWEITEAVENSVPVKTGYFGPDARNEFPIRRGRGTGRVWIPAGTVVPPRRGRYQVSIELRELGGGRRIDGYAGEIEVEEDMPASARILLPSATRSCRIEYASWDATGGMTGSGRLRLYVQSSTPFTDVPDAAGIEGQRQPWPGHGHVGIDMDGPGVADFRADTATAGTVSVSRGVRGRRVLVRVRNFEREIVHEQTRVLPGGDGTGTVRFGFSPPAPDVYDLAAELWEGDRLLDRRELRIGLRDPRPSRPFVEPELPALLLSHEQAFRSRRNQPEAHEQLRRHCEYVKRYGDNTVGISCLPSEVQPLPGVYRFHELDERVRIVSEAGLKSHIYLVTYMKYWPEWVKRELGLDQDGRPDDLLSIASPALRAIVADLWTEVAGHFRSEPDVVSYGMWGAWCEWSYRDSSSRHYDYCPSALQLWREFSGGLAPPVPTDSGPDLRPEWRKWASFRTHLLRKWFCEAFGEAVRAIDPKRRLVRYLMAGGQGAMEELYPDFQRLGITPAHGGADGSDFRKHGVLARQYGLLYRHESVSAPARHPLQCDLVFFHGLFNGLPEGATPALNVAWNIGWNTTSQHPGVLRARERRAQLLELLRWMHSRGFRGAANEWAQFHSWDDMLLGKGRDFQWYGLATGLYWADKFEHISYDGVSDRTPLDTWRKYACIVSYRPRVVTPETASTIAEYVSGGGTFVLVMAPGPGMASMTGTTAAVPSRRRVAGIGMPPWFAEGRRLVLTDCGQFPPPAGGQPIVVEEGATTALGWDVATGGGHLLMLAGTPAMPESKGFLEDILRCLSVRRHVELVSGDPADRYPPEALELTDGEGNALLLIVRGTRWNNWRQLKEAAGGAEPTMDGLASAFPRRDVHVTYFPAQAGTYRVDRWDAGSWSSLGTFAGAALRGEQLKVHVAPAELSALRFTPKEQ